MGCIFYGWIAYILTPSYYLIHCILFLFTNTSLTSLSDINKNSRLKCITRLNYILHILYKSNMRNFLGATKLNLRFLNFDKNI